MNKAAFDPNDVMFSDLEGGWQFSPKYYGKSFILTDKGIYVRGPYGAETFRQILFRHAYLELDLNDAPQSVRDAFDYSKGSYSILFKRLTDTGAFHTKRIMGRSAASVKTARSMRREDYWVWLDGLRVGDEVMMYWTAGSFGHFKGKARLVRVNPKSVAGALLEPVGGEGSYPEGHVIVLPRSPFDRRLSEFFNAPIPIGVDRIEHLFGQRESSMNKNRVVNELVCIAKSLTARESLLDSVLIVDDVAKLNGVVDEQSYDLAVEVYSKLRKDLELSENQNEAIIRLRQYIQRGPSMNPDAHRNNIFKAAHALGIRLPSSMF